MGTRKAATTAGRTIRALRRTLPAAIKPIHSLWHEILGLVFLMFAVAGAWKVWRSPHTMEPIEFAIVALFIFTMAAYGVSSIRKARRISRS